MTHEIELRGITMILEAQPSKSIFFYCAAVLIYTYDCDYSFINKIAPLLIVCIMIPVI